MPPQPHSVTSFSLLCLDVVWSLLYNDIINDERSAYLSTLPRLWMKILNQVPAPISYPLPFFHRVRNTRSPIKSKKVKVIEAKLLINRDTAAESGASHWRGTSPLKLKPLCFSPARGHSHPFSRWLSSQELPFFLITYCTRTNTSFSLPFLSPVASLPFSSLPRSLPRPASC